MQEKSLSCQVTFFLEEQQAGQGTSSDFSERGMLVRCDKPASLNKRIKLQLRFPTIEEVIEIQGIVVWTNIHGPADAFTPRGMGVKFVSLDRAAERLLAKLATRQESEGSIYKCYYS